jgi:hypothetical protein
MISVIISEIAKKLSEVESGYQNLSVRKNDLWRYKRADDNIFALASTLYILQKYSVVFSEDDLRIFEKIQTHIKAIYPNYQNKDGRLTYNFYRTKPSGHFPNGILMRRLDHFRLPDDIDDTALIYLTSDYTKEQTVWLKNHLLGFTDQFGDSEKNRIYGTWFGKNMPKEQDVCALLNLMCLFFKHNLELNHTDRNTLEYLGSSVDQITTNPFKIARHYGHPALIIYHYARFMGEYSHKTLDAKKSQLIEISKELLLKEKNKLFRILLETSLLQFGEKRESMELDLIVDKQFYSFIGAPLAPFQNPALRFISQNRWLQIFWKSEIHELALVLEYDCLSKKQSII